MRNLVEYPLTADELISDINHSLQQWNRTQCIGSTQGYSLALAIEFLKEHKQDLIDFVNQKQSWDRPIYPPM